MLLLIFKLFWKKLDKVAESQYTLGTLYELGEGVAGDDKEAFKGFSLASSQGYAKAQNNLGYMYDLGEGVEQIRGKLLWPFKNTATYSLIPSILNGRSHDQFYT